MGQAGAKHIQQTTQFHLANVTDSVLWVSPTLPYAYLETQRNLPASPLDQAQS